MGSCKCKGEKKETITRSGVKKYKFSIKRIIKMNCHDNIRGDTILMMEMSGIVASA